MLRTIKSKLFALTSLLIVSLIFMGVFSVSNLKRITRGTEIITETLIPSIIISQELDAATSDYRILEYEHIIATDKRTMDAKEEEMNRKAAEIKKLADAYEKTFFNDTDKNLFITFKNNWQEYENTHKTIIALSRDLKTNEAMLIMNEDSKRAFDKASASLLKLVDFNKEMAKASSDEGHNVYSKTTFISMLIIPILAIAGVIFAWLIISGILKSLKVLKGELAALSERGGDLTQEIKVNSKDELADLAKALNLFLSNLRNIIKSVKVSAENTMEINEVIGININELMKNMEDVSSTTEELSAGMEETAASAEEIAATTQEIEGAVQAIAKKSQEGAVAAGEINERAAETKERVIEAKNKANDIFVQTKAELEEAITNSKVVEQIDVLSQSIMNITAQTNLLALNAAIEASRAGEAGRGFSVVADEIRKLAEQSKESITQIQLVTRKVTESVENLSKSSNKLLLFMSDNVAKDYDSLLNIAEKYSEDASFVEDLVINFSSTSAELLVSIQNTLQTIQQVADASGEGAVGTTNIAEKIVSVNDTTDGIVKKTEESMKMANSLKEEMAKFVV